ncbi:MAG: hypothetical protein ACYSW0_24555 [Planctomycetota bacterium]|jgi:hypothetical protein
MDTRLIIHTASLYYWFSPYEQTLDERIHAALDAGFDGVEISNGPSILTWRPRRDTIRRLHDKAFAVHAELYPALGVTLQEWTKAVKRLPFEMANAVFHPDELHPLQLPELAQLPFPASIENMDAGRDDWRTAVELQRNIWPGVGFTFDTAHANENCLNLHHFATLPAPRETHLSLVPQDGYFDIQTAHAMTHLYPDNFPIIPSSCPLVTVEGVIPASVDLLETELDYVREKIRS